MFLEGADKPKTVGKNGAAAKLSTSMHSAASTEVADQQHHTRPCPCGLGALAMWPWVVQTAQLGF